MSKCIAKVDCKLIGVRNKEEMTPLFLVALNGKKHAFLCLDDLCSQDDCYHYCRRNNGEIVLHSAFNGEFFGLSSLHVMATKPSAFKSGSCLAGFDKIVYYCTFVDELRHDKVREEEEEEKKPKLRRTIKLSQHLCIVQGCLLCTFSGESHISSQLPILIEVVKLITKAMLIILGCGTTILSCSFYTFLKAYFSPQIKYELFPPLFCLKDVIKGIRLLVLNTKEPELEICQYAKEGKVVELAALLMTAREKVAPSLYQIGDGSTSNAGMLIRQCIYSKLAALTYEEYKFTFCNEKKLIRDCKEKKMAFLSAVELLDIFEMAGDTIETYIRLQQQQDEDMAEEQVRDFLGRSQEQGYCQSTKASI
ncbi:hypothetical protein LOK49_LG12G02022 [Camellia lanceoleosa]|uniref:Uncharacterized protein n=1 Tax=Camellia lanceoleosa TaxID=1840588 RepID=A0ACC0FUL2_9ERIC|nr:hypothetical protein LOK49_LG12G02022 [Camellia lanceoleosa]